MPMDFDETPPEEFLIAERSPEEAAIVKKWRRFSDGSRSSIQEVHDRAKENWDFASPTGDQWAKRDRDDLEKSRRPVARIDDVGPVVKSVAGREVTSRYQPKVYPPTEEDAGWADLVNEAVRYVRAKGHFEHEESDAFHDLQIQATAWMHLRTDVRKGRVPETVCEPVPIWEMSWDTRSRRTNLADREWHARTRWLDFDTAKRRWPSAEEKLDELKSMSDQGDGELTFAGDDEKSSRRVDAYVDARESERPDYRERTNELRVTEFEWREVEAYVEIEILTEGAYQTFAELFPELIETPLELQPPPPDPMQIVEMLTQESQGQMPQHMMRQQVEATMESYWQSVAPKGKALELSTEDFDEFAEAYEERTLEPFDDYLDLERDVYRYAILSGRHVLAHGRRKEEDWTYHCMAGWPHKKKDETIRYTCVDVMKDPQRWVNRFYSLQIELLATAPKNPLLYKTGTFVKSSGEVRAELSRPNAALEVANLDGVNVLKTSNGIPQVDSMFEFAKSRVPGSLGLNPYSLGQVTDLRRTAASSVQSVTQSASSILSQIFDSLRLYRIKSTRLILRKIVAYWEPEDLERVVGPKLAQHMRPKEEWNDLLDYDVRIDEVPATPTQKLEVWESLMQTGFLQQAMATPYAPPPEIFVGLFPHLSESDKELWLNTIKQQQQAEQPPPEEGAPPPEEEQ